MINLHQLMVHFPVALLVTGCVFSLIHAIKPAERSAGAAWWNLVLGTAATIAAVLSGRLAEHDATKLGVAHDLITHHERLGYLTAACWIAALLATWRSRARRTVPWNAAALCLQVAGVALLVLTAHAGGTIVREMVYR